MSVCFAKLDQPFRVMAIDGAIPQSQYEELARSFPVESALHFPYPGGKKENFNQSSPGFAEFMSRNQIWGDFYRSLPDFGVKVAGPALGVNNLSGRIKFEFSMLPTGGGLKPHPDSASKALTGVFYFTPGGWKSEWGGNFEAVRHRKNPEGDFTNCFEEWDEVDTLLSVPYVAGRSVFMARANNSLHGVRPVSCPDGVKRLTVTVNWMK